MSTNVIPYLPSTKSPPREISSAFTIQDNFTFSEIVNTEFPSVEDD